MTILRTLAALHLDLILRPCHDALSRFVRWATEDPACRWAQITGDNDD